MFLLIILTLSLQSNVQLRPDRDSDKEKWLEKVLDFYEEQIRSNNNNVKDVIMDEPDHGSDNEEEIFDKRSVKEEKKRGHLTNHTLLMPNVAPDKVSRAFLRFVIQFVVQYGIQYYCSLKFSQRTI